ncbi:IS3 family transposase [Peribacillus loiseleuriae]|uniref:IS3 family transposase n=1 Tax=Peribacillus loiseleuriae TaxID=1679170 RepID=UPI003CFFE196
MVGRPDEDAELKELITTIYHEHNGLYRYRRNKDELKNRGHKINHKKVQQLMKELTFKVMIYIQKKCWRLIVF